METHIIVFVDIVVECIGVACTGHRCIFYYSHEFVYKYDCLQSALGALPGKRKYYGRGLCSEL